MTRDTIIGTMGGLLVVLGGLLIMLDGVLIMLDGVLINQKSQLNTRIEDLGSPTSSATDRPAALKTGAHNPGAAGGLRPRPQERDGRRRRSWPRAA